MNLFFSCCLFINIANCLLVYRYFIDVVFPLWDKRKLPLLPKNPNAQSNTKPRKMPKRVIDIRGPELVHNKLIHKQFGVQVTLIFLCSSLIASSLYLYVCISMLKFNHILMQELCRL